MSLYDYLHEHTKKLLFVVTSFEIWKLDFDECRRSYFPFCGFLNKEHYLITPDIIELWISDRVVIVSFRFHF